MRKAPGADEYYLEARDATLAAARALDQRHRLFVTPGDVRFHITWRMPLRIYLLGISRTVPGQDDPTVFSFQRNGRVNLGGDRKIPLSQAMASGHEPWASRAELAEATAQLAAAVPVKEVTS